MSQQELLKKVAEVLGEVGIPYMVTGSVVSSLQGEPRSTHDIDLVVAIEPASVKRLVSAFAPPQYYLDEQCVRDAIGRKEMFNLIEATSGDKIDFWPLTNEPFDRSRFARKHEEEVLGVSITVSSPENTILAKLKWAKASGGSEKQYMDALRVYEVQFGKLDISYIEKWVAAMGVEQEYMRLTEEAEVIS